MTFDHLQRFQMHLCLFILYHPSHAVMNLYLTRLGNFTYLIDYNVFYLAISILLTRIQTHMYPLKELTLRNKTKLRIVRTHPGFRHHQTYNFNGSVYTLVNKSITVIVTHTVMSLFVYVTEASPNLFPNVCFSRGFMALDCIIISELLTEHYKLLIMPYLRML